MFDAICPHCLCRYRLDDSLLGKKATCKQCRQIFALTEQTSTETVAFPPAREDSVFDIAKIPSALPPVEIPKGVWKVGEVILGIYEVKPIAPDVPFAAGGVGVVNKVYHKEWDIDLAVKSPKPDIFKNEAGKRNYEKEAQTWIELGLHPNIVTCYLVRRIDEIPRLFAEFVPDGSLKDWITDGRLYQGGQDAAMLRVLDIAIQFAWGLHHAHSQTLLHLDVKPANVMMSGQTAKVSDFGLSQSVVDIEKTELSNNENAQSQQAKIITTYSSLGLTPGYCSPEQYELVHLLRERKFDNLPKLTVQSDMWSWAVSVLAMLNGSPPCKNGGQNARSDCERILQEQPSTTQVPIPQPVGALLLQCFEPSQQDRPDSMKAVADALIDVYQDTAGAPYPRSIPISASGTPDSLNNLAASMIDLNKPNEAVKLFEKAIGLQPWHPEVTYNQTLFAWRSAKATDAGTIERLETLVKMRPKSATALYGLGLAQLERGNAASAFDAFIDALEWEDRPDIRRAIVAAEKKVEHSARCLDRFSVAQGGENSVFVDNKGEFVLYPSDANTLQLRSTLTGQIVKTFNVNKSKAGQADRIALSKDLLQEIIPVRGDVALRQTGAVKPTCVFSDVNWIRNSQAKSPQDRQDICLEKSLLGTMVYDRVDISNLESGKNRGALLGHDGMITAFTFSPDGCYAVTGGEDRTLRIWEIPSCRCLRTLTGLQGTVDAVYFEPRNRFVLSLVAGGSLRIWDIRILCQSPTFHAPILLSFITSSEEISKQQHEMNRVCDEVKRAAQKSDYAAALQLVEKAKAMPGWNSAKTMLEDEGVSDTIRRHCVRDSLDSALCTFTFQGDEEPVTALATSPDTNLIISAGRDARIRVWNISERRCSAVMEGHQDWIRSVALTNDARFLVSGSWDSTIRVWNVGTGQCVRLLNERIKQMTKLALNPQGQTVAAATGGGSVILYDVLSNRIVDQWLAHTSGVNAVQFSRNGHYLVTGGEDNKVKIWKIGTETPVRTVDYHQFPLTDVQLSVDMSRVFSSDTNGKVICWDLQNNKLRQEFQGHLAAITALRLLPDERFLLTASRDATVRITRIEDLVLQHQITGNSVPVTAMSQDVAGKRIITAGEDGVVRVWDLTWNFQFPGWQDCSAKAEAVMRNLLSLYSSDGVEPPKVDAAVTKRILLEMEYRGFGTIPSNKLKQMLEKLVRDFSPKQ
ncbi:hypothetical protein FACS189454_01900 [Planctomycetales bacterium]|nr:hypothetical protein FACS189454_01900 [Planctomycetales bacterium]